ncbi:heavy metal-binding domain-containing protein [Ferrovibrio sp.]|uniref:heavy metal-binding domain-containing protein n=1 Tax=Ferrovibrio sp. TaxID=1917215 RepID=UPI002610F5C8|nr:heavy metal-binding domain-containing protein [Ferrovibrio sp.]
MILTSTDSVDGKTITAYLGIVAGEAVMGTNVFRDFFAGITDILGGRSGSYEKELRKAKALALESLVEEAKALGADAVVGMDLDYQQIGGNDRQMLMVAASGTAVKLGQPQKST